MLSYNIKAVRARGPFIARCSLIIWRARTAALQTYQVSRIRRETYAFGLCLMLTRTATIFLRIGWVGVSFEKSHA